jgi:hypothetical protein
MYKMYEELHQKQVLSELKDILEKAEEIKEDTDAYCALMKTMILNTYSAN